MEEIKQAVQTAVKELFDVDVEPELTRPDEQFGDYATNVSLQLAAVLSKNPKEIADQLTQKLGQSKAIAKADSAGPGFINIHLTDEYLAAQAFEQKITQAYAGKVVVAEYSDPNPFKILHAGHLYTSVVGDAMANLVEVAGGKVHRVNFGGDVGLHVGKTMWAILQALGGEHPDKLKDVTDEKRTEWLAEAYVKGTNAYEDNERAKQEIILLNKRVYQLYTSNDHDSPFAQIYWTTRQWSYDYFDEFYKLIGTKFEKYYPESEVSDLGLQTVKDELNRGVFEQSDGAVVFKGEKFGLHTRVFINSEGLPTYEAKDVGLILTKKKDYNFDVSIVITGNEQEQYMTVVLKAIEQFAPELALATKHIPHGIVKLAGGVKMSSRKGNILRAVDVLDAASQANQKATGKVDKQVELGAVKYAFLKQRIGADIIYDPVESVSLQGNSGPYLQYAYARACSLLAKGSVSKVTTAKFEPEERSLLRKISEYPESVNKAVTELMPHYVCTYLYELAQSFNRFYENNRVIGDARQEVRLKLVETYANTLKNGLSLLNINAPDKM